MSEAETSPSIHHNCLFKHAYFPMSADSGGDKMLETLRRFAVILPIGLAVAGCQSDATGDFGTLTYRAVDQLASAAPDIARSTPIVVASVSDAQNIDSSSEPGNIIADMVRTRLVQDGLPTSEIRLRNAVQFRNNEGEFLLSRDPHSVLSPRSVAVILTGTYTATAEKVYISLKLISAVDAQIFAGVDFVVPYWQVAGLVQPHST